MQLFAINFRPRVGMGWFLCKNGSITLPKQIFVPAWGWDGSKLSEKYNKLLTIFVPEWGWVGSENNLHFITTVYEFSSPSGDGLVLQILTEILKNRVIRYRHNKQL